MGEALNGPVQPELPPETPRPHLTTSRHPHQHEHQWNTPDRETRTSPAHKTPEPRQTETRIRPKADRWIQAKPNAVQLSQIATTHCREIRGNGGCAKIVDYSN